MRVFQAATLLAVSIPNLFAAGLAAQDGINVRNSGWKVEAVGSSCSLVFEDPAEDAMFSYQINSYREFMIGFRPAGWNDRSDDDKYQSYGIEVIFDDENFPASEEIDPLIGRIVGENEVLTTKDFRPFQMNTEFEVRMGKAAMLIPTTGLEQVRSAFDACLGKWSETGKPPNLSLAEMSDETFEATAAAAESLSSREIVLEIDRYGSVKSCRTVPNVSASSIMRRACAALKNERYTPAQDADGKPIEGEFVFLRK